MSMVRVNQLVKEFPSPSGMPKIAVNEISFEIASGETYGLLGPNGAGKTTTLRMLSGMMRPTRGTVIVNGLDVSTQTLQVKSQIGFLTANTGLYPRLTPRETLVFFAEMLGLSREQARQRAEELIQWLDMQPFSELRCGALSTGQKQRVNIARSLVADPPVLIMDEPTLGLDVLTNRIILNFIRKESAAGKTVLLSTHYLDEAEGMCDRVGLLHDGHLIAEGTLDELRAQTGQSRLTEIFLELVHSRDATIVHEAGAR